MARKGIFYYSTKTDMATNLSRIETMIALKYTQLGLFDSREIIEYSTYKELPNFGYSLQGTNTGQPIYLIYPKSFIITPKEVPQRNGEIKYSVNDMDSGLQNCFRFVPAGEYKKSCLIPGEFSPGLGEFSEKSYKVYRKEFLSGYKKVKSYSVSPEAYEQLQNGMPLTPSYKATQEMHLKC